MRKKQKIINLYNDNSIRSIKHVISIGNEEDLNQFWHYFHSEVSNDYKLLYRFISIMYAFTENLFAVHKNLFFELIIEQNEEMFYFTLWNEIVSEHLQELLAEQEDRFEYLIDEKRICIKLAKETLVEENVIYTDKQKNRRSQIIASLTQGFCALPVTHEFLEEEDKSEILRLCEDMSDIIYRAKKVGFQDDVVVHLRSCLTILSLSLMSYPQFSYISNLIVEFSVFMNDHKAGFKGMSPEEFSLVEGFIYNIDRWADTLFVSGGADLHFMDNSLKADLDMIKMLIHPQELVETSMDDIFDF